MASCTSFPVLLAGLIICTRTTFPLSFGFLSRRSSSPSSLRLIPLKMSMSSTPNISILPLYFSSIS
uniref:Uncharacterized protein n=2 Tax=Arundo donax TaxID=35708 RepID=A0A0A9BW13_ARUDO